MRTINLAQRPLAAERSPWLRGNLAVPGDFVIAHLALVAATLARGESVIDRIAVTPDFAAAVRAMVALGARIDCGGGRWHVTGLGAGGLLEPRAALDLGGSATGLALAMGLLSTYDFPVRFTGDPDLASQSFEPLLEQLRLFGTTIGESDRGRLPIAFRGPRIAVPVEMDLPEAHPMIKAALLVAALNALGTSRFTEPAGGWDHAERLLAAAGASVTVTQMDGGRIVEITGLPDLRARQVAVPGDPSLAALGAVAASIVPGSDIRIEGVLVNPARTAVLSALVAMGAAIEVQNLTMVEGEQVADLAVRHAPLRAIALADHFVGPLVADLPALAIAAAFAEGETVLNLPRSLGYDDRGRLAALARGLVANGIACDAGEEAFVVAGAPAVAGGGTIVTSGDPRLAIAFLVLGMASEDKVTIDDETGMAELFPGFVAAFENIGASFVRDRL